MAAKQSYCEVDTWTVGDLVDACELEPEGKRHIIIPRFQRRLVWNQEKKAELISSIKQGYPIGSLLLYEDAPNKVAKRNYRLIDGLQRTQALREYNAKPTKFFARHEITDDVIESIGRALSDFEVEEEKIISTIVQWVHSLQGFAETDSWGVDGLLQALIRMLELDQQSNEYMRAFLDINQNGILKQKLAQFLQSVRESSDISKAKLPVVIYNGPAAELPNVFALINSKGTGLSRYEIFAAQWIDQRQRIQNEAIIKAISDKYKAMENEGYTLEDISQETPDGRMHTQTEYTLFEYLFGLGQFLSKKYSQLFKQIREELPSSAGFNLVTACAGERLSDMVGLPDNLKSLDRDLFEKCILDSIDWVQNALAPILSVSQRKGISIYHTEYQIISMIASAFHLRYDVKNKLKEFEGWRKDWNNLKHNLPMFYLYDILRDYWRGSGDTKLYETVTKYRYVSRPPTRQSWTQVLDAWFREKQVTLQHDRRYIRDATPEILLLKFIYAHILTVAENSVPYHIEHVIPVDQLINIMPDNEKWPINAVSNLALLRAIDNRRKGNKTYIEYLDSALASGKIDEDEYMRGREGMSQQLICPEEILPSPLNKQEFKNFLERRFDILKEVFYEAWQEHIPNE